MRAEIVSIGTELLLGTITDTNASYLAGRLALLGIDCFYISQVGDNLGRMREVLHRAWTRSDLTVTTGGLGPTADDLTREAIAAVLGESLYTDEELAERVRAFFRGRGVEMPERNLNQAMLVPSAAALYNPVGTAPGWWVSREVGGQRRLITAMPGVPFEMKRMWEVEVEPRLRTMSRAVIASRTLKVMGIGESSVEKMVADLMLGSNPTLAPYAKQDGIHLRITSKARSLERAEALIAPLERAVRDRLGDAVYGVDDETPVEAVQFLLAQTGGKLVVVEVGEGAVGSVTSQWAAGPDSMCVAAYSAEDWPTLLGNTGWSIPEGSSDALEAVARSACERAGADTALAISCTEEAGRAPGTVHCKAEVVVLHGGPRGGRRKRQSQQWETAPSEVPRLVRLAALNQLRTLLLEVVRAKKAD